VISIDKAPDNGIQGQSLSGCQHNIDPRDWVGSGGNKISYQSDYRLERQTILDAVVSFAPSAKGRLLDVGCGHKPYAPLFLPYVHEYVGLDLVESPAGNDADVIGSVSALPFDDASFDTVISTQVIEHVPEPHVMLREIARVLRPGGVVLVTAPFAWPLHEVPHDFQRFTRYGLEYLATAAGLTVDRVDERGGLWMMMTQLLSEYMHLHRPRRWIFRKLGPPFLRLRPALFAWAERMDRRYPDSAFTLGYAMTARKPIESNGHG